MVIYTPSKYPKETFLLITIIVFFGIVGTYFLGVFFMLFALIFWMHYTALLSYMQFKDALKKKKARKKRTITTLLLNPQIRFFIFEFLAWIGFWIAIQGSFTLGYAVLVAWWMFSFNFYVHYMRIGKNMKGLE